MSNSTKVMIDVEGGNNILYLPLDKIAESARGVESLNIPSGSNNSSSIRDLTNQVIALVDNHPILKSDLDLALKALSMNKDNPITEDQIKLVIERLIDEQLLNNEIQVKLLIYQLWVNLREPQLLYLPVHNYLEY